MKFIYIQVRKLITEYSNFQIVVGSMKKNLCEGQWRGADLEQVVGEEIV